MKTTKEIIERVKELINDGGAFYEKGDKGSVETSVIAFRLSKVYITELVDIINTEINEEA